MAAQVQILGGGLAGPEAAWQIAQAGIPVTLYEMRPERNTPAHKTSQLGELVCSNSLKSAAENTAPWLLKEEMRRLGCFTLEVAERCRVPGGHALTVDRAEFAAAITRALEDHPRITVRRQEVTAIPEEGFVVVATGPLTSAPLAASIARLTGAGSLYFYDSISPIVEAESIDPNIVFRASRYGKSLDGTGDYLNCPLSREEYERFLNALSEAECYQPHIAEDSVDKIPYFESCLPVEEIARRGRDTLRFGPMKPVGLVDPRTGRRPYAAVQLRQENLRADSYNLVGFQSQMKFGEQARVFRLIPGLENAVFLRYGQVHRNTYINAPALLRPTLQLRSDPRVFFAGQICGVEGYVESMATGLLAGRFLAGLVEGRAPVPPPRETALGSLCHYITNASAVNFQPANITFDLLPPADEETRIRLRRDRKARHAVICRRALDALDAYLAAGLRRHEEIDHAG